MIKDNNSNPIPAIKPNNKRGIIATTGFWKAGLPIIKALIQQKNPKKKPESVPNFHPNNHANSKTKR